MTATTRWAIYAAVPLLAVAVVSLVLVGRSSRVPPAAPAAGESGDLVTWAAGAQPSPPIALRTPAGVPFSLGSVRGRRAIVTFVDPHCTTFCPRESLVIDDALRTLATRERPAVVAVSVDPSVTSARVFAREAARFRWTPQWRWVTGTHAQLSAVWNAYHVTVLPTKHDITHTELVYVLDANGDQRALLLWPFHAKDVLRALAVAQSP